MDKISLRGVKTHNLKNINLELPRDKLLNKYPENLFALLK